MRVFGDGCEDPGLSRDRFCRVDVLKDPAIRAGIKGFSDWPTVPQLYVRGEFVGGADIVREMFQSGELKSLLIEHLLVDA